MRRASHIIALLLAGCTARVGADEVCAFTDDCADPLVCADRRCRLACRSDRDCLNGTVCRSTSEFALRVCQRPTDPWRCAAAEDCAAPLVCGPTGRCQPACRVDDDCRFVAYRARCDQGVCRALEATDAAADVPDVSEDAAPQDVAIAVDVSSMNDVPASDATAADVPRMDAPPMDAVADVPPADVARRDVALPPTWSYLDVTVADVPPTRLRGVFARLRVCAVRDDGATFCWGPNPYNTLGLGADAGATVTAPTEVPSLRGAAEVAMALESACARMDDGTVRCAGRGLGGQLGNGTSADQPTFAPVVGLPRALAIRAGETFYCALVEDGTVRCWGLNNWGQLGDGSAGNTRATPVTPRGLTGVTQIALGNSHACARRTDGTVWCWGAGSGGQLGNGSANEVWVPTAVPGIADATWLGAGAATTCVARADGSAWCWGSNLFGVIGDGAFENRLSPVRATAAPPDVRAIETGGRATCVIHGPSRAARCWGMQPLGDGPTNSSGSTNVPAAVIGGTDVVELRAVSHNISASCFTLRRGDGATRFWGAVGAGVLSPVATSVGIPYGFEELVPP